MTGDTLDSSSLGLDVSDHSRDTCAPSYLVGSYGANVGGKGQTCYKFFAKPYLHFYSLYHSPMK